MQRIQVKVRCCDSPGINRIDGVQLLKSRYVVTPRPLLDRG